VAKRVKADDTHVETPQTCHLSFLQNWSKTAEYTRRTKGTMKEMRETRMREVYRGK